MLSSWVRVQACNQFLKHKAYQVPHLFLYFEDFLNQMAVLIESLSLLSFAFFNFFPSLLKYRVSFVLFLLLVINHKFIVLVREGFWLLHMV